MENTNYLKINNRVKYSLFLLVYIFLYIPSKLLFCRKKRWLICERGNDAQDNGYCFYSFLKAKHKEIRPLYLITKNSKDIEKINKEDRVGFASLLHFLILIGSKVNISSHLYGYCPWPTFATFLRRHKTHSLHVFLQHGITYNNQPGFYKLNCQSLKLFICGAAKERDFIIQNFGYNKNEAILTGFARFDNYQNNQTNKTILIMPTWRRYLTNIDKNSFQKSNYYNNWFGLINNSSFVHFYNKNGYKLVFYIHEVLQKYSDLFQSDNVQVIKHGDIDVQHLLKSSQLLITDYSSVFFDFLYQGKNAIFFQFDRNDFWKEHYSKGYFDQLINGLGNTYLTIDDCLKGIEQLIDKHDTKQILYMDDFFGLKDNKNCQRIFDEIQKKL